MSTVFDYFTSDNKTLSIHETRELKDESGKVLAKIIPRLHLDFTSNSKYVSFYIGDISGSELPEAFALRELPNVLDWNTTSVGVSMEFGKEAHDAVDLKFTGQIYIYSEREVPDAHKERLHGEAKSQGHMIVFRGPEYAAERAKNERPLAFISHDSRDKEAIAQPLAASLQGKMCPVWFDEYSLRIGDSLRDSIEKGLKECGKCVLVLTPNFLSNDGWAKREYDMIFTRELVEKQNVILPIWCGVSAIEIYEYSPILANRVAANWEKGLEDVTNSLVKVLRG